MSDALPTFLSLDFDPLSPNGIAIVCPLCKSYHVVCERAVTHRYRDDDTAGFPKSIEILMYCDHCGQMFSLFLGDGPGDEDGTDLTSGTPSKKAMQMDAAIMAEDEVDA